MNDFVTALRSGKVLVMDGAMGTELMRRSGAPALECGEIYNLTLPHLVGAVHWAYLESGADVILTNTFQANRFALARQGLEDRRHQFWKEAIRLAELDYFRPYYMLADIGPLPDDSDDVIKELVFEGKNTHGLLLETWSSLPGIHRFASHCNRAKLPLLVSFTFQRTNVLETFTGVCPEACAREAQLCGAAAIGANCGKEIGMSDMLEIVQRYREACDLPIFIKPNAGTPSEKGYPHTPEAMAAALPALLEAGIAMVGGCCGATPEHIRQFRAVVDEWNRRGSV